MGPHPTRGHHEDLVRGLSAPPFPHPPVPRRHEGRGGIPLLRRHLAPAGALLLLLVLALLAAPSHAGPTAQDPPSDPGSEEPAASDSTAAEPAEEGEEGEEEEKEPEYEGPGKPFDEVTEDLELQEGFFDLYTEPGKVLMAVTEDQLDEPFLVTFALARGIGAAGLNGGTMLGGFEGWLLALERQGDKLYLVRLPHHMTAPEGGKEWDETLEISFDSSILEVADIATEREDGAVLVDATDWFVGDLSGVGDWIKAAVADQPGGKGQARLDGKRSYLEEALAFEDNLNFRAKLTFDVSGADHSLHLADGRSLPLTIHTTVARLPEDPMEPRLADDRTGYFMTVHKDFTRKDDNFFVRYINRWRLERGKKRGDLYEPKEPIVYHLDHTIPSDYRKYVEEGVEAWQEAYEAAGWKNAIIARDLPEGARAEDINYATLRWMATDRGSYLAIGPSRVDPRTGEILDADILFDANFALRASGAWGDLVNPSRALESHFESLSRAIAPGEDFASCEVMGEMAAMQVGLARAALMGRGEMKPGEPMPEEFMGQFLKWVTMHEVGHTLGLRHNFKSSMDTPFESLHDNSVTRARGLTSSVMDYAAPNIAPKGTKNGDYYGTTIGTADKWMIRYGYVHSDKEAAKIAREVAQPGHTYGSDEDRLGPNALDPGVNAWDLGDDPLAWSQQRCDIVKGAMEGIDEIVLVDNARPYELNQGVGILMGNYAIATSMANKYIGGAFVHRDHVGDPGQRPAIVPVSRAKQEAALDHVVTGIFAPGALEVSPELVKKMGPDRWLHWGRQGVWGSRTDFPYHDMVAGIQGSYLRALMQPARLQRLADHEAIYGADQVLTLPEVYGELTAAIWAELEGEGAIRSTRRNLQREYVEQMGGLLLSGEDSEVPADAIALTRHELKAVASAIEARLARGGDAMTVAHLEDLHERIGATLAAQMQAKL